MALDVVSAVEMEMETVLGVHSGRSAMRSRLDSVMRQSFTFPLFLVFLCRSDINLRSCRFIAPSSYLMACGFVLLSARFRANRCYSHYVIPILAATRKTESTTYQTRKYQVPVICSANHLTRYQQ
jgi:hypothetical protein